MLEAYRSPLSLAAALLLLCNFGLPQTPSAKEATFRSVSRLVNVNVVVADDRGNPVRDLSADDFTILDDGRPQKVSFFSRSSNEQASNVVTPPAALDTYTNSLLAQGSPPNVTILLFDTLNSNYISQGYALHRVRAFLRTIRPRDHLGIYVLGDTLDVVHEFNHDASDLVEAMRRYDERQSHREQKVAESPGAVTLDRFLDGKDNQFRAYLEGAAMTGSYRAAEIERAVLVTLQSLQQIARQLSAAEGRRTIVWIVDGQVPLDFSDDEVDPFLQLWRGKGGIRFPQAANRDNVENLERAIRLMNSAGIAVYTLDARGLETGDLGFRNFNHVDSVDEVLGNIPQVNTDLIELAARTGGRAFYNRNDLDHGLQRALNDSQFTYSLAYYPDHGQWKGEWRKLQVKVNRPGITVLARSGYFALPDPRPLPSPSRLEFLRQIAESPIESSQLPLTVHISSSQRGHVDWVDAKVHVDFQRMLIQQKGKRWSGHFELLFFQLNEKGKVLDVTTQTADLNLKRATYQELIRDGKDMPIALSLKHGASLLCVILHDKVSDAAGSVRIPLARYAAGMSIPASTPERRSSR